MKLDHNYWNGSLITLQLIEKIFLHLESTKKTDEFLKFLEQLEKSDNSVKKRLKLDSLLSERDKGTSNEKNYWIGVQKIIKISKQKWIVLHDNKKFLLFLQSTREMLKHNLSLRRNLFELENVTTIKLNNILYDKKEEEIQERIKYKADGKYLQEISTLVNELNLTVSKLPNLLKEELNQSFENKIVFELGRMKSDMLEKLTDKIDSIEPKYNVERITETKLNFNSDKITTPNQQSEEISDMSNKLENNKKIEQIGVKNDIIYFKSLPSDLSTLTLKEALKILKDEDSI